LPEALKEVVARYVEAVSLWDRVLGLPSRHEAF
jgi:hypothetical protein